MMETIKGMLSQLQAFDDMVQQQKEVAETQAVEADAAEEAAEEAKVTKLSAAVDTAYLIASADGTTSADELSHIANKVSELTDNIIDQGTVQDLVHEASAKCDHDGRDGCIAKIASVLTTQQEREAAFMVAAAVSWTGGGIGAKEGLALQAISKAFGWEMSEMHKLLGKARS
jgi:tellurite resistance protein